jgi:hypothetical protein
MSRKIFLSVLALILASLACNLPQETSTPQILVITTTPLPATNTPVVLPSPTLAPATLAPLNTPTLTPIPCNQATFEKDVNYPDNTTVTVNQAFTKTWRIRNTGSCTWTSAYQLVFDSGDPMGGPPSQSLIAGTVAPNQSVDISVNLVAPSTPGTYHGNWRIREPGGTLFGVSTGAFWVQIKAVAESSNIPDWPVLTQGNTGSEVYALQYLLRVHGQSLTADGIFGTATRAAVINFQSSVGITQDGTVGANTWSALISGLQLVQGNSGDAVRAVQQVLHDKYSFPLTIDGVFGSQTYEAVREFQLNYGLPSNGIVTLGTWQALISY